MFHLATASKAAVYADIAFCIGIVIFLLIASVHLLSKPLDNKLQGYRDIMLPWSVVFAAIVVSLVLHARAH